jgi:hypothetical protein
VVDRGPLGPRWMLDVVIDDPKVEFLSYLSVRTMDRDIDNYRCRSSRVYGCHDRSWMSFLVTRVLVCRLELFSYGGKGW